MENATAPTGADIVNTERYPIHDRHSANYTALVHRCRAELNANLWCTLPEMIRPEALAQMAAEATGLRAIAHHNNALRNCYLHRETDPELPSTHPRNLQARSSVRMIAYDQIAATSPLKAFYHWDALRQFVADITGNAKLYDNEDPYQPANYVCYEAGDESSWHFDADNAFTMTLMVQTAEEGGEFQISPHSRTDDDQNYDHVSDLLAGRRPDTVVSVGREPGALCIFRGCNSLHRVSPVRGETMRIMGVFVYESKPGVKGDPRVNATIYGPRVAGG